MLRKVIITRGEIECDRAIPRWRFGLVCAILCLVASSMLANCPAALAWPTTLAPTAQVPQPAVVRVIASERDGTSMGSGSLVAVDAIHGLVVTNWHVVRDATGPITVVFP